MKSIVLVLFVLCLCVNGYGQRNKNQEVDIVSHQVKRGETVKMLSQKYLVAPADIYKLNKFAVDGISQGMVLQIPVPRKEAPIVEETVQEPPVEEAPTEVVQAEPERTTAKPAAKKNNKPKTEPVAAEPIAENTAGDAVSHKVQPGETLNGLAKKYNVSVADIKSYNEKTLKRGLQSGQTIKIPAANGIVPANEEIAATPAPSIENAVSDSNESSSSGETIKHEVVSGETLYSISRKYGISVDEIKKQNDKLLKHGLQTGQVITISK